MNTKNIRHIFVAGSFCCAFVAALTACTDWDDHYSDAAGEEGGLTLWEHLNSNPQVSDFCRVLENTKVIRQHKKTAVSYADLLNSGQQMTVIAPINGTFNADSLIRLTATNQGDSMVEKSFVANHLSRSAQSVSGSATSMLLLNSKHVSVSDGKIGNVRVTVPNQRARNGVYHIAESSLPYQYNLFEALCDLPDMSEIGKFLRLYNEDYFDETASVSNGMVDGLPVYVDSVIIEKNDLLEAWGGLGKINSEDSAYWVVAPTTAAWKQALETAKSYFVYDKNLNDTVRDSLQNYYAHRALLEDAIFNLTDQRSVRDSIVSVPYVRERQSVLPGRPVYHVFKRPFDSDGIIGNADSVACSNGTLYKTSELTFDPMKTYFREIWTETENQDMIKTKKWAEVMSRSLIADSISQNAYLRVVCGLQDNGKKAKNWELTFRLDNVLSGDYDVYMIVLPRTVYEENPKKLKKNQFLATINYIDTLGNAASIKCNDGKVIQNADPARVDSVLLYQGFSVPSCNYGLGKGNISVTITTSVNDRQASTYDTEMFIDCIYLRPRPRTAKTEE